MTPERDTGFFFFFFNLWLITLENVGEEGKEKGGEEKGGKGRILRDQLYLIFPPGVGAARRHAVMQALHMKILPK